MDREKLIVIIISVAAIAIAVGMLLGGVFKGADRDVVDTKGAEAEEIVDRVKSPVQTADDDSGQPAAPKPEPRRRPVRSMRTAQRPQPTESDIVLREPIFGVYLGESLQDLHNRLGLQSTGVAHEDFSQVCDSWFVMTHPEYLSGEAVISYDGRVCSVAVYFSDATQSNYDALKQSLLSKYGNMNEGLTATLFGEVEFFPTIDGIGVAINMNRDQGFMADDSISLTYHHRPLVLEAEKEIARRKSSVVDGDL